MSSESSVFNVTFSEGGGCGDARTTRKDAAAASCSHIIARGRVSASSSSSSQQTHVGVATTRMPVEEMSTLVADEMNKLTFQERELVYEDLHGVSRPQEEFSDIIAQQIQETRKELANLRVKSAYNKAVFLNPDYVDSDEFTLMFLRSCKFDPKQTANKIVDHFKYKMELFGYDNVGRDLVYGDLDEGTKNAISSGAIQVLPQRDNSGRAIIFYAMDALNYDSVDSQLKAIWYILMRTLSDPSIQRHGTVQISYNVEYSTKSLHLDLLMKCSLITKAMPQKIQGVHFCYNNEIVKPVLSMLQMILGASARLRFRSHFGSFMEVKYSLQNFGIPQDTLPIDSNSGKMDCSKIQAFIQEQQEIAALVRTSSSSSSIILHPLSTDVLMGRGWHQQEHPGNLELARIVDDRREEYKMARKLHKTNLNWTIVEMIRASGGRFLERSTSSAKGWIEVSDDNARDKVSKCFRTTTKRSTSNSSTTKKKVEPTAAISLNDGGSAMPPLAVPSSSASMMLSLQDDDDDFPNKKARVAL